jgi:hypothetical protein
MEESCGESHIIPLYNEMDNIPYAIFAGEIAYEECERRLLCYVPPTPAQCEALLTCYNKSKWRNLYGEKALKDVGLFDIEHVTE